YYRDRQRRRRWPDGCAFGTRRKIPGRRVSSPSFRSSWCEVVREGVGFRGHGGGGRPGPQPEFVRADPSGPHRPSSRQSLHAGTRLEQPCACPGSDVGRPERQEQWTVCAVLLGQRLTLRTPVLLFPPSVLSHSSSTHSATTARRS